MKCVTCHDNNKKMDKKNDARSNKVIHRLLSENTTDFFGKRVPGQ